MLHGSGTRRTAIGKDPGIPAMVLDARYMLVAANRACAALFGPQVAGSSFVHDTLADPATAQTIVNWPEVACAGLDRLRQDARRSPFDPGLRSLISLAEAVLDGVSRPSPAEDGFMVCPWFRIGSTVVRTIAMTARFDHIAEVTLDELRIELMYLMDDDAGRFFRAHDSQARLPSQAQRVRNRLSAAGSRRNAPGTRSPSGTAKVPSPGRRRGSRWSPTGGTARLTSPAAGTVGNVP